MSGRKVFDTREYDAIAVLGASLRAEGAPSPILRSRVTHGAKLLLEGKADTLLLTGGGGNHGMTEAETMRSLAVAAGVPENRIILESLARSTFENAEYAARLMRERGWTTALVVSDRIHLPRALLAFHSLGIRATGSASGNSLDCRTIQCLWYQIRYAAHEFIALLWYAVLILVKRSPG